MSCFHRYMGGKCMDCGQPFATKAKGQPDANGYVSPSTTRIGTNLHNILAFLEITQVDFAKRVGITQAAVSQLVNGEREPSLATVEKILQVLPITFERLTR